MLFIGECTAGVSWTDHKSVEVLSINGEMGIFARRNIDERVVIGIFDGVAEVFTVDEKGQVDWRGQDGGMSIHLKLCDGLLYTIMPIPSIAIEGIDFINHSCKSNCRSDPGTLVVETTRPVAKGEQLTLNYHDMDLVKLGRPCWCANVPPDRRCIL